MLQSLVEMSEQRKPKILKPDQYSEALGDLIEREFFPDLSRLRCRHDPVNTKRKSEVIDLTDSSIEDFHSKTLSNDEAAFRASQEIDRKRHSGMWTKVASRGESSKLALRLHPPSQVPNSASSKPLVRRENTRLPSQTSESALMIESKIQATLSAKSVIQESARRADIMIETGQFTDDDHYSLPPIDPREEVAIKLEQDILRGGLRKK